MTRPRGRPPIPSAMSRPSEPVETASTSYDADASPRRMTEPLPNCFSIWPSAALSAFLRLSSISKSPLSSEHLVKRSYQSGLYKSTGISIQIPVFLGIQWPRVDDTVYRARLTSIAAHQHESLAVHTHRRHEYARPLALQCTLRMHL